MRMLVDLLLTALDLFEAEARALRRGVIRLGIALVLLGVCMVLLLAAFGLATWGVFLLFVEAGVGATGAAFLTALVALLLAAVPLLIAKALTR